MYDEANFNCQKMAESCIRFFFLKIDILCYNNIMYVQLSLNALIFPLCIYSFEETETVH